MSLPAQAQQHVLWNQKTERQGERPIPQHHGRMTNFFVNFVSFVLRNRMHKLFRRADELSHFHEMKVTDGIVRMILPGANWAE
jgi:hypothetical protein